MESKSKKLDTWFFDLLSNFSPNSTEIEGKTPKELINHATWKTSTVAFIANLVPGPIGYAVIIPEILAVTKIQLNLIDAIARHYGKSAENYNTAVVYIFANALGLKLGKKYLKKTATKLGTKLVVRIVRNETLKKLAQKIGLRLSARIAAGLVKIGVPFLLAPVFTIVTYKLTKKIGKEADSFFSNEITYEDAKECSNGHENDVASLFCSICGEKFALAT